MKVLVLGATGNIGQQVISLIKKLNYQLVGISYYANDKLAQKIEAKYVYSPINKVQSNVKSYNQLIKLSNPDIVVNAIVGFVGLKATLATIRNKKTLCLANKESLVVAGQFVMKLAKQKQVNIFPIDSEHTAIYQIISQKGKSFKKLYITASGGPFYNLSKNELTHISLKQAINHPTWKMGTKISIDSATLINKCFEMVEAFWYFKTKNIEPLYHPQSLVHAVVEYQNAKWMFVSKPDMQISIRLALQGFKAKIKYVVPLNNNYLMKPIDAKRWLPIKWAYQILNNPYSSLPIIINAANEVSIQLFVKELIGFDEITKMIQLAINKFPIKKITSIKQIFALDKMVRVWIQQTYLNSTK